MSSLLRQICQLLVSKALLQLERFADCDYGQHEAHVVLESGDEKHEVRHEYEADVQDIRAGEAQVHCKCDNARLSVLFDIARVVAVQNGLRVEHQGQRVQQRLQVQLVQMSSHRRNVLLMLLLLGQ